MKKAGYLIPPTKTAELRLELGEVVQLGWALEPISVFGTVTGPRGESAAGARVMIDGTGYEQVVGENGTYRFEEWKGPNVLVLGETYTLSAKLGNCSMARRLSYLMDTPPLSNLSCLKRRRGLNSPKSRLTTLTLRVPSLLSKTGLSSPRIFRSFSSDLTVLLFSSFADTLEKVDVQDVTYLVVTAKLAEQHRQPELAKR